jgi:chromate transport protein ChrA
MRLVPNPWGNSWFDYVKAVIIGLVLLIGFVVAIHRGSWIATAVWAVLLAVATASWARDLMNAMRRKSGTGRT